jgi:hypothetical protein
MYQLVDAVKLNIYGERFHSHVRFMNMICYTFHRHTLSVTN